MCAAHLFGNLHSLHLGLARLGLGGAVSLAVRGVGRVAADSHVSRVRFSCLVRCRRLCCLFCKRQQQSSMDFRKRLFAGAADTLARCAGRNLNRSSYVGVCRRRAAPCAAKSHVLLNARCAPASGSGTCLLTISVSLYTRVTSTLVTCAQQPRESAQNASIQSPRPNTRYAQHPVCTLQRRAHAGHKCCITRRAVCQRRIHGRMPQHALHTGP